MYSTKLYSQIYYRTVSIIEFVRTTEMPLERVLDIKAADLLSDGPLAYLESIDYEFEISKDFQAFLHLRKCYFPDTEFLFPTLEGVRLRAVKFSYQIGKFLESVGAPTKPTHPAKLTEYQLMRVSNTFANYGEETSTLTG